MKRDVFDARRRSPPNSMAEHPRERGLRRMGVPSKARQGSGSGQEPLVWQGPAAQRSILSRRSRAANPAITGQAARIGANGHSEYMICLPLGHGQVIQRPPMRSPSILHSSQIRACELDTLLALWAVQLGGLDVHAMSL